MTVGQVEPHESALVEAARSGDTAAFAELVRRHQDHVYSLAVRLVGQDLAPDVAQEAFIRAWRAIGRFRGEARFGTWIHRITVNTAWTQRRRALRHDGLPIEDVHPDPSRGPQDAADMLDVRRDLKRAIDSLSDSLRIVLVLRDIEGWSTDEVAQELGISTTAAKVRLHRARSRVRELIEEGE